MPLPVPALTRAATGATMAMTCIMLAVALSVLAMGHALRPVLQWEIDTLERLTKQ